MRKFVESIDYHASTCKDIKTVFPIELCSLLTGKRNSRCPYIHTTGYITADIEPYSNRDYSASV